MDVDVAIAAAYDEARSLLPQLRPGIRFELDPRVVVPGWGVGGFAAAADRVLIGVDESLDESVLAQRLRGAVFHECFHVAQSYGAEAMVLGEVRALQLATYEGCATVFERDRAGDDPPWSRYLDDATMLAWADELASLPPKKLTEWTRWLFWDPATQREHVIYRTGTFLVDRALAATGARVEDLVPWSLEQLLAAASLPELAWSLGKPSE